jgi:hypothetical protein
LVRRAIIAAAASIDAARSARGRDAYEVKRPPSIALIAS